MRRTMMLGCALVVGSLALGAWGANGGPAATAARAGSAAAGTDPCATPRRVAPAVAREAARRVARGDALVAVDGNRLVTVGTAAREGVALVSAVPGMVRHLAAAPGFGTAYVADRRGADTVVALTPSGTLTIPQPAEVTHPTWSPRGDLGWSVGTGLRVRPVGGGAIRRIATPVPGGRLFSPVFRSERSIVAVLSSPPTAAVPEDERLNNLWRYDLVRRSWHRVTRFSAGPDRWSAIRTPVQREDGSLEFVRIVGRGSAAAEPAFQLWGLARGRAQEVRALAGERYLAGEAAGRRLWNVPDPRSGRFRILREHDGGGQTLVACGAVMTDPLDTIDPDRRARRGRFTPPRGHWPGLDVPGGAAPAATIEVGILVGDYTVREQAEAAAARITAVLGAGAPVTVVDASSAPDAIRPGAFGAMLELNAGADVMRALADFRARLPEFATSSWVVSP